MTFLLLLFPTISFTQNTWKLEHRLQAGLEQDSNVFEASEPGRRESSLDGRLHFKTLASRSWQRFAVRSSASAGLQGYPEFSGESKFIGEAQNAFLWKISKKIHATLSLSGFRKGYADGVLDFLHGSVGLKFDFRLSENWRLKFQGGASRLDYDETRSFDHNAREWRIGLNRRLRRNVQLGAELVGGEVKYGRNALALPPNDTLAIQPFRHEDDFVGSLVRLMFGGKFLVNTSFEYTRNRSNSYGYSYDRLRFSTITGFRPGAKWLIRFAAVLQQKTYDETLLAFSSLEQDVERNQNNYVIADVSYDISRKLSYLVRVSIFKNEAFLRGTTYSKSQLFVGVEYRF